MQVLLMDLEFALRQLEFVIPFEVSATWIPTLSSIVHVFYWQLVFCCHLSE
jgi:hypothetical protein